MESSSKESSGEKCTGHLKDGPLPLSSKHCGKELHESSMSPSSLSSESEECSGVKCKGYLKDGLWDFLSSLIKESKGEKRSKHLKDGQFPSSSKQCDKELHESSSSGQYDGKQEFDGHSHLSLSAKSDVYWSLSDEEVRCLLKSLSEQDETIACNNFKRTAAKDIRCHLKSLSKDEVCSFLKSGNSHS
ncbi:hypothetical protein A4A49_30483 [Nicotiana attenuata]|uniref:Uncharacterized protein n=1 Tax=Nicotiana attenuata TaxID=49451 RepID=A0A1J6JDH3_NICAT|nr:hypothetical protein A4A49_30483 [Nicotiana attenuata]